MTFSSKKIGRNTLYNVLGKFGVLGLNLLIVPFIVAKLGREMYGVWVLVQVISGAFAFFDFGLGASIIKFVSQYWTLEKPEELNKIVSSSTIFFLAFSMLFGVCAYPLLPWLAVKVFQIPSTLMAPALFSLRVGLIGFVFAGLANLFQSVLFGAQRMGMVNGVTLGVSGLQTLGIFLVLYNGLGLQGMAVNHVLAAFALFVSAMIGAKRAIPSLAVKWRPVTKEAFRHLFAYGIKLQIITMTSFLIEHLNKIFIASLAGLQAVTSFDVAMKVINLVRLLPLLPLSALVPPVSALHTLGDRERLRSLYIRGTKYLVAVLVPVAAIAILAANPITELLFGNEFTMAAHAVQILTIAYGFNLFTGMGTTIVRGIGKPELEMQYALVSAFFNIILVYGLGSWFGYYGLLAGMALAIIAGSWFFVLKFHQIAEEIWGGLDGELSKNLLAIMLPALAVFLLDYLFTFFQVSPPHYAQFQPWLAILLFVPLYAFTLFKCRFFDAYDRNFLRSVFQFR